MSNQEQIQAYLDFAIGLTEETGKIALKYFRQPIQVVNKSEGGLFDPVTAADKEIEDYIRRRIGETYPEHSVIGEESENKIGTDSLSWVIDPIDGTRGFVAGSPMWGTLIGLLDGDECVAGLMHQPFTGETYIGSSAGAYLINNEGKQQIKTSDKEQLSDAILACTHLSMFHRSRELDAFVRVANTCRFSRFGTDCYGYALLAHGFIDVVVEAGLAPYDIMAMIPVVEAAGGVVTDWQGNSAHEGGNVVAAANPELHEQALNKLS